MTYAVCTLPQRLCAPRPTLDCDPRGGPTRRVVTVTFVSRTAGKGT